MKAIPKGFVIGLLIGLMVVLVAIGSIIYWLSTRECRDCENVVFVYSDEVPGDFYFYLSSESGGGKRYATSIELTGNELSVISTPDGISQQRTVSDETIHSVYNQLVEMDVMTTNFELDWRSTHCDCLDCTPQAPHVIRVRMNGVEKEADISYLYSLCVEIEGDHSDIDAKVHTLQDITEQLRSDPSL